MKFLHLSDLHLGKILHGYSMIDDQEYILQQILHITDEEKPDAVLLAGDIYDKPIPPAEAVRLFDRFLRELAERRRQVYIISGNHDSVDRLSFGAGLMEPSGVHIAPAYNGNVIPYTCRDTFGDVRIYLLPFIKPVHAKRLDEEAEIESYTDALRFAVSRMNIDPNCRNILVTHQFVTGGERSDSEDVSVGGSDNVDAEVFEAFDYVALGHLHAPQHIGRETIRYCGTPLKYSFSEKDQTKSVTIIELSEKGNTLVRTLPLTPRRDLREIRGSYDTLTLRETYLGTAIDDYLHIVLTDEQDVPDAVGRLRVIYPNLMKLDYDNTRTRASGFAELQAVSTLKDGTALFEELFEIQNGQPMQPEQRALSEALFQKVREGSNA